MTLKSDKIELEVILGNFTTLFLIIPAAVILCGSADHNLVCL